MKLKLAALVVGALLATGAHAQLDVGYELGSARLSTHDNEIKTRVNHNFKVGFLDEAKGLGAEAVYVYTPKAKYSSGISRFEHRSNGAKLLAKAELPIASHINGVVKGGLGYQHSQVTNKNTNVTTKHSEYFPAVAVGLSFKANEQLKIGVNLNHDSRDHYKFKENTYLTAGFDYAFDASKLA